MKRLQPGQLVRLRPHSHSYGAAQFFVNGSFSQANSNLYEDPLVVISYPAKCRIPKYGTNPESWCEVMDSQGRVGALYPASFLEVIE